ncbi:uncharacterized protein M421DRAFT_104387 [Didymella exigua CBS 183.55]|uniref:Uncharacterized protein n=1 Tax=Didymella exigua CBS 183.55 TaxID=1150837 RepID=A0A6A5R868_9PLEO|nr:uncharacterized protein M421DRAFT_104387 [Didymella exigua CBS 183.55]KAF1923509.1 hypothetical protein M421DRAFT_104387 [Didymella exigua CBS 183.55]
MSQILVLPTPLPSSSFALGQLLRDPLSTESISFKPTVTPAHNKPTTQTRYEDIISRDEEGRLISSLGKTASTYNNAVVLTADEMSIATLANPYVAFEALRRDTEARSFLRKSALQHQPLYFVTGIQKLKNASYRRSPAKEESTDATRRQIWLPMHVRCDSAGLESEKEDAEESVFAVELMKVACRAGAKDEPHSLEDIDYTWTYHALDEPDMHLSIGLGKVLQAKELRALASIIIDEDLEPGHYDQYFDDEGLAGFSSD